MTRREVLADILHELHNAAYEKLRELDRHRELHPFKRRERRLLRREYYGLHEAFRVVLDMVKAERALRELNDTLKEPS